jgi:N-acetylglucosamine kinase-like BadF-type ATPase
LPRADALVAEIYQQLQERRVVASLGTIVDRARADGDLVAADIMTQAADELAISAASVISQLDMRGEAFPILLAGGMLKESPWLAAEMGRRMAETAPRARVEALTHEPVFGAVRLAIAEATAGVKVPQYIDA